MKDHVILKEVKDYLKITWDDDITNSNILKSIHEGKYRINGLVGTEIDFDKDLDSRSLLKDYCRYARENSLEYFEENFQNDIVRIQLNYAIKQSNS